MTTMELLRNAFVAKNADISIREPSDDPEANFMNEPTDAFDMQFNENTTVPEACDFDNGLLPDDFMSALNQQLSIDDTVIPVNIWGSRRRSSDIGLQNTIYGDSRDLENTRAVSEELITTDDNRHTVIDSMEMEILDETIVPDNRIRSSRKRKSRRQPFKDVTLNVNVEENVITASTTQRQSNPKDDSVSKTACISNLSRKIFDQPSHSIFSESMLRQFESRSMSGKLMESFKRMTLTKTEGTNRDMVQEYCSNLQGHNQPVVSAPIIENTIIDVTLPIPEFSLQMDEISVEACSSQPASMSIAEEMSTLLIEEPPSNYQHMPVELSPVVRQILTSHEVANAFARCDTDSQKLFASRSRQNKLDWGTEGVLQKLMSLWNSGIYPIGMHEIMQSNNQRISAATAFFSVMELNSARIGLINITKSPNSNTIFNINKSPKLMELIELQQIVEI